MDDWTIKASPPEKVIVPSFVRLFVIARIVNHCNVVVDGTKQMVTVIKDLKQQQIAQDILTRLTNDGIKKYMEKWFSEKEQIQVIEIIFNKIILKQFEKEYQATMIYNINDSKRSEYYQTLVFNTDDLISLIFQFIELNETFTGDLINCSLVNSHWLYQSWNPNSIYKLRLDRLITNTIKMTCNTTVSASNNLEKSNDQLCGKDLGRILSSKWQRVSNVKSLQIALYRSDKIAGIQLEYLLEKVSMLRSIVDISLVVHSIFVALLKPLLYYNKKSIERYYVIINGIKMSKKLQPLELIKAQNISVITMYYYITWSHRCKTLHLQIRDIDENWMRFVIDNCDCCGVERLILKDISVSHSSLLNPETKSTQLLFKKFAQKFNNLQSLKVTLDKVKKNVHLILLLRCLSPILKQNSTMVALDVDSTFMDCDKLTKMIQDTGIKIYQLSIWITEERSIAIDCLKPILLNNAKLEYLKINNWISYQDVAQTKILDFLLTLENENSQLKASSLSDDELIHHEEKSSLSSLKMIHIDDEDSCTSINTMDQMLRLKLIQKHDLYIKMCFQINVTHSTVFQESFTNFCQTVASLLMSQEIPIELCITINDVKKSHFEKIYCPIFQQYLNQDVVNNFKTPIVNKYCNLLPKPLISLTFDNDDDIDDDESYADMEFQVCNVTKKFDCIS